MKYLIALLFITFSSYIIGQEADTTRGVLIYISSFENPDLELRPGLEVNDGTIKYYAIKPGYEFVESRSGIIKVYNPRKRVYIPTNQIIKFLKK